jgi:muconate cycloisomerase
MIKGSVTEIELKKCYPLVISGATFTGSINLFVKITSDGFTGLGEFAPASHFDWEAPQGRIELEAILANLPQLGSIQETYATLRERKIMPPVIAAIDMALWDLKAKKAGLPLYELLGLSLPKVPTSITIGINPPEVIAERVPEMLSRTKAKYLKIKLGSPDGLDADQEIFLASAQAARAFNVKLRVDANGGWKLKEAEKMCAWLSERQCEYVEQPLAAEDDADLKQLFEHHPLPIFVDESCWFAADIPRLADRVDGINLKLMKCGGITEALRMVAVARAHKLQTMIGCMGESSVAISAAAALGSLFDHIDLDSHLNLLPDPANGAELIEGIIMPTNQPGHGAVIVKP